MSANGATWSSQRIEQLKYCFQAGLTCSQIASEIGVTRNAVIGKMHRLGLTRPQDATTRRLEQRRAVTSAPPKTPRVRRAKRLNIFAQHELLTAAFPALSQPGEDVPIHNGRGCTLLELGESKCRWPINEPGAADFCYCGNEPVEGLPYCLGHARIAYRKAGRPRMSA